MTPNPMNLSFSSRSFVADMATWNSFPPFFTLVVSKFRTKPFSRQSLIICSNSPCLSLSSGIRIREFLPRTSSCEYPNIFWAPLFQVFMIRFLSLLTIPSIEFSVTCANNFSDFESCRICAACSSSCDKSVKIPTVPPGTGVPEHNTGTGLFFFSLIIVSLYCCVRSGPVRACWRLILFMLSSS